MAKSGVVPRGKAAPHFAPLMRATDYYGLRIEPHRQAGASHVVLGFADAVLAEMEDRGGEHRGRMAVADAGDKMIEIAGATGSDHRHGNRVGNGSRQRNIISGAGPVLIF